MSKYVSLLRKIIRNDELELDKTRIINESLDPEMRTVTQKRIKEIEKNLLGDRLLLSKFESASEDLSLLRRLINNYENTEDNKQKEALLNNLEEFANKVKKEVFDYLPNDSLEYKEFIDITSTITNYNLDMPKKEVAEISLDEESAEPEQMTIEELEESIQEEPQEEVIEEKDASKEEVKSDENSNLINNYQALYKYSEEQEKKVIDEIQSLFKKQREEMGSHGIFVTEKELNDFNKKYMDAMEKAEKRLIAIRGEKERIYKNIEVLSNTPKVVKQMERPKQLLLGAPEVENLKEDMKSAKEESIIEQPKEKQEKEIEKAKEAKETKPEVTEEKPEVLEYGYKTIVEKIVKDVDIKKTDGKRYQISNLKIKDTLKKELSSGNYIYNIIHTVPTVLSVPVMLVRKAVNKFLYTDKAKKRISRLKARIDFLPDKDVEILANEYANHTDSEMYGSALNILIGDRVKKHQLKKVEKINARIEVNYKDIFNSLTEYENTEKEIKELAKRIIDKNEPAENKDRLKAECNKLLAYKSTIFEGKAKQVASIREDYEKAKNIMASGIHGFMENIKAAESKMNYVGYRFAKEHDLDQELIAKQAELERKEKTAIRDNNDEYAVRTFVESEKLMSRNTALEKSVFGLRSVGKKYYRPLVEELNYKNDNFYRDIFSTIAITSAAIGAINALTNHGLSKEVAEINEHNQKVMDSVHNVGDTINSKKAAVEEGIQAQNYQDSLNISNMLERKSLDQSSDVYGGWSVGTNAYKEFRTNAQSTYNNFYQNMKQNITDIGNQYNASQITDTDALVRLNDLTKSSQETLASVVNESMPYLTKYAENHSQFDLVGVKEAMDYISANPYAITNMNKAVIDITDLGEELSNLSLEQVTAINSLPTSVRSTIVSAASAAALALNVSNTMNNNAKKNRYGNDVTAMVYDYMIEDLRKEQVAEEQTEKTLKK